MSKAVLVIDMPESCEECPFCNDDAECDILGRPFDVDFMTEKPSWCPMRPIPEKRKTIGKEIENDILLYRGGWNACIDAIGGGDGDNR